MNRPLRQRAAVWMLCTVCGSWGAATAAEPDAPSSAAGTRIVPLIEKGIPELEDLMISMITVEYAPGASTPRHRHPAHTFVYVLEGAIDMQVDGSPPKRLSAGDTFYESPADLHAVSRNASATEKAKFLVFFLKQKDSPVLIPVK